MVRDEQIIFFLNLNTKNNNIKFSLTDIAFHGYNHKMVMLNFLINRLNNIPMNKLHNDKELNKIEHYLMDVFIISLSCIHSPLKMTV